MKWLWDVLMFLLGVVILTAVGLGLFYMLEVR